MRRSIEALKTNAFDVLVIGAGVHGAWIAMRAARAGCRVALIDKHDFGAATSANSLNILHGGLRYLQHLDFVRMRSSVRARREFARRFSHLTRPLPCLIPLQAAGIRSPWFLGPALLANDVISFDRNSGVDQAVRLPMGRLVSGKDCDARLERLVAGHAAAGAIWWDLLSLDSARLVIDVIAEAERWGAVIVNRVQALEYLVHGSVVSGVAARDVVSGCELDIKASVVVNATGPWAGQLSKASRLERKFLPPGWSGGLNLVLRRPLGIETAAALSMTSGEADKSAVIRRNSRELFFVPWRGVTMVGTEYLPSSELPPEGGAGPPLAAVEAFVAEINRVAPRSDLSSDDIAMTHWGIVPTESADSLLPRKTPIVAAGRETAGADGLVVVIGEKLTSAPVLSSTVLKLALAAVRRRDQSIRTIPVPAVAQAHNDSALVSTSALAEALPRLASRYGSRWPEVAQYAVARPDLLQRMNPGAETLRVEVVYAIRDEMALGLDDLLLRRLGVGIAGHPGLGVLKSYAALAAEELGWSPVEAERAVTELDQWYARRTLVRRPSPGSEG